MPFSLMFHGFMLMVKSMSVLLAVFLVMLIVFTTQLVLYKKPFLGSSGPTPLEAGFESLSLMSSVFSSSLVFLSILFVMFDLEIILLIPVSFLESNFSYAVTIFWFLTFSLMLEWKLTGLKWYT